MLQNLQIKIKINKNVSVVVTYLLSCNVSEIWLIIGPIFAVDRLCVCLMHSLG